MNLQKWTDFLKYKLVMNCRIRIWDEKSGSESVSGKKVQIRNTASD
jgi:hypothetical protein